MLQLFASHFFLHERDVRAGLGILGGEPRYLGSKWGFWCFPAFWAVGSFVGCVRGRGLSARTPRLTGYILVQ